MKNPEQEIEGIIRNILYQQERGIDKSEKGIREAKIIMLDYIKRTYEEMQGYLATGIPRNVTEKLIKELEEKINNLKQ